MSVVYLGGDPSLPGLVQRITIGMPLLWMFVAGIVLYQYQNEKD